MTEQQIKNFIKKEILLQTLINRRTQAEIGLEIILRTGLINIHEIITIKNAIETNIQKYIKEKEIFQR